MSDFQYNVIEGELDLVGCSDDAVERFIVNVTYSSGSYSADKTYAEITAAIAAGKIITLRYLTVEYVYSHTNEGVVGVTSSHCFYESNDNILNYVKILSDESVEISNIALGTIDNLTTDETVSAAAITSHDTRLDAVETLLENGNVENLAAAITAHRHLRVRLAEALQRSGSGNPTTAGVLPEYIGQEYNDTTNKVCYRAFGLTAADWVALN